MMHPGLACAPYLVLLHLSHDFPYAMLDHSQLFQQLVHVQGLLGLPDAFNEALHLLGWVVTVLHDHSGGTHMCLT